MPLILIPTKMNNVLGLLTDGDGEEPKLMSGKVSENVVESGRLQ